MAEWETYKALKLHTKLLGYTHFAVDEDCTVCAFNELPFMVKPNSWPREMWTTNRRIDNRKYKKTGHWQTIDTMYQQHERTRIGIYTGRGECTKSAQKA